MNLQNLYNPYQTSIKSTTDISMINKITVIGATGMIGAPITK